MEWQSLGFSLMSARGMPGVLGAQSLAEGCLFMAAT
jgi:hypothetical protein